jgi:hypothetical protein
MKWLGIVDGKHKGGDLPESLQKEKINYRQRYPLKMDDIRLQALQAMYKPF